MTAAGARQRGAVAVVTGAGHGIGAAVAHRLAAEGASIAALDLDSDAALAVVDALPTPERAAHQALAVDVTDRSSVDAGLRLVEDRWGRVDLLVNVAGGGIAEPDFARSSDRSFSAMLDLNYLSVVRATRAALSLLRRSDRAAVVNITSVNGLMALGSEAYSAAKAAVGSLTTNLAVRYAPEGIRVNAVAPGTTRTRVWTSQRGPDRLAVHYPLGRVGEPEDIAAAVAFLGSSDASWITGQTLAVDGGLTIAGIPDFGA